MITQTILSSLIHNEDYTRKVIPYLKKEYFKEIGEQVVFILIKDYFLKYNNLPSKQSLGVELENLTLRENIFDSSKKTLSSLNNEPTDLDWLVDVTEDFCKKRAFYNAIAASADLLDQEDTSLYNQALGTVQDALSVSFDANIGQDFFEDAEERFKRSKEKKDQLPVGIPIFDKTTKGGYLSRTLTMFMAPTGVGKSLFLCNFAAQFLLQCKNVLYITMEMSEDQVYQRVEMNLLDIDQDQHKNLSTSGYLNRLLQIKAKTSGRLIAKEYTAHTAHSGHFRYLISDLELKKDFTPDIIIVDYLNICSSARVTPQQGMYLYYKSIAEELRGLGQEYNARVFSATQVNREGAKTSDFGLTETSESWGVTHTADYFYGMVETEELANMGQMKVLRLKDRFNDYKSWYSSFLIGVDKSKQRIYDIDEQDVTDPFEDDTPVFDNSSMSEFIINT